MKLSPLFVSRTVPKIGIRIRRVRRKIVENLDERGIDALTGLYVCVRATCSAAWMSLFAVPVLGTMKL